MESVTSGQRTLGHVFFFFFFFFSSSVLFFWEGTPQSQTEVGRNKQKHVSTFRAELGCLELPSGLETSPSAAFVSLSHSFYLCRHNPENG